MNSLQRSEAATGPTDRRDPEGRQGGRRTSSRKLRGAAFGSRPSETRDRSVGEVRDTDEPHGVESGRGTDEPKGERQ